MSAHVLEFRLTSMCRVLRVHRSGYYAWAAEPQSDRAKEYTRLLGQVKPLWLASDSVYGYRMITKDLRAMGETCSRHRIARIMKSDGIRAQVGYGSKPRPRSGPIGLVDNILDREFNPGAPNTAWVTDITYIRTYEGWLYLAVVIDLFSRQVVGWAARANIDADLVVQALLSAVWRRKPAPGLIVHSDQGSQFTSDDWQDFLKAHGLVCSMSRRGNCHDNAVAESFFGLLKRERIKRRIYRNRELARTDVVNYIEMFYNPIRQHGSNGGLSPVEFERRHAQSGS